MKPATVIDKDIAWKLFSKSIRKEDVKEETIVNGNHPLGEKCLTCYP